MADTIAAELDRLAEQRAADHAARVERIRRLREELAAARAEGKRTRHARRLAREAARTTEETSAAQGRGEEEIHA